MSVHTAHIDLPTWPANWTALTSTINTTCQQHSAAPVVSTTDRHHWPGSLATCSKHVDDDDDDDDDADDMMTMLMMRMMTMMLMMLMILMMLVQRAVQWIAEWNTFRWTFELNVRGIAPSSSDSRDTYLVQIPEPMSESVAVHMTALRTDAKTQKDWAAKYRRHWGLQYTKLGIGHDLTEDEIRDRVPLKCPRCFFFTQKRPPEMGVTCFQKWIPVLVKFAHKWRTQK